MTIFRLPSFPLSSPATLHDMITNQSSSKLIKALLKRPSRLHNSVATKHMHPYSCGGGWMSFGVASKSFFNRLLFFALFVVALVRCDQNLLTCCRPWFPTLCPSFLLCSPWIAFAIALMFSSFRPGHVWTLLSLRPVPKTGSKKTSAFVSSVEQS